MGCFENGGGGGGGWLGKGTAKRESLATLLLSNNT